MCITGGDLFYDHGVQVMIYFSAKLVQHLCCFLRSRSISELFVEETPLQVRGGTNLWMTSNEIDTVHHTTQHVEWSNY